MFLRKDMILWGLSLGLAQGCDSKGFIARMDFEPGFEDGYRG